MANPFDVPDGTYLVLVNARGQHSLWPTFADPPDGWTVAYGAADRTTCLGHVSQNWTDLRPRGLGGS